MEFGLGLAWAQGSGGGSSAPSGGGMASLIPFVLIFVVFYFLLIRPQQRQKKQHREMLVALKKGDRIVTSSGILGTVTNIHKNIVTLQLADNIKIKIKKDFISSQQAGEDEG